VSSANRDRRRQNRENRHYAAEEALRRARRQRITLVGVGLAIAVVVAIVLVSRAADNGGKSASKTTTPSTESTSSTESTTTTTIGSAAGKPCVGLKSTLPAGTPTVPVPAGPAPTKLIKLDLKVGTGAVVKAHSTISVNYVGVACSNGKLFTSTFGQPATTGSLDGFVAGWRDGIPGMKVGGQRLLGIPPALAYGTTSPVGSGIAPNETLWFVVEVSKVA
jgi:FKBP-type peptidyl-prolyl cis-trans isomerase